MDISENSSKIEEYITHSRNNPDYELEALLSNNLTSEKFKKIYKYLSLSNDYEYENEQDSLDIRIVSNKSLEKYRLILSDKQDIKNYCQKNTYDPNNISYGIKNRLKRYPPIVMTNYPIKLNLKYESNLEDIDERKRIDSNIQKSKKFFRYKKRFSFLSKSKLFRIDLSIVKSNPNNYSINFFESNVLNSIPKYEIEIEFNNNDIEDKINNDKIIEELFTIIGNLLMITENNEFIITNQERNEVKNSYLKLAFKDKNFNTLTIFNPKKYFVGVQPITLELKNLLEENSNNILKDYTVTEKADGERNLLYIHSNNRVYLIDNRLNIKYTGLKHNVINTIIDGEYITKDKYNNEIKLFMGFDIYFYNGKNITDKPLLSSSKSKSRLSYLNDILNKDKKFFSENGKKMEIKMKKFEFGDNEKIFEKCKKLLNNKNFEYKTDGLIFTPKTLGVGQKNEKDKINLTGTWNKVFKWKPPEESTIDFLIKFKGIIKDDVTSNNYMFIHLYVGYDQNLDINPIKILNNEFEDNIYAKKLFGDGCYLKINSDGKILTNENEIIEDNMIIEFSYNDKNDNDMLKWEPYRIRKDKTELYKITQRISGTANDYSTAQNVWNTIQNPITMDIIRGETKINSESDIYKNSIIENEIYYNREISRDQSKLKPLLNFHNKVVKNEFLYKRFDSTNSLFEIGCGKGGDLHKWATSKFRLVVGSDVNKDNLYNIKDGIYKRYNQLVKNGIINTKKQKMIFMILDGGELWDKRYFNSIDDEISQRFSKIIFNPDNLIKKSDFEKDETVLLNFYNKGIEKFNLVSIQFAIHYMFKDMHTLQNFVKNVDYVLKENGYFFGTCLDGNSVNEKLKNKKIIKYENDGKLIWKIEKKYDSYSNTPSENTGKQIAVYMETINQLIDEYLVDYELLKIELGKYNIRPLNEFDTEKLRKDIDKDINISSGSFKDIYNIYTSNKKNKIDNFDLNLKEYSFLNRWFIFKKYPKSN